MASINGRANKVKQPRGGYVNPRMFHGVRLDDNTLITDNWNIHESIVSLAVDGLTKVSLGNNVYEVFKDDIAALKVAEKSKIIEYKDIEGIFEINGNNRLSIVNACKLAAFGIWDKNYASTTMGPRVLKPNEDTIQDIQKLVNRSVVLFSKWNCSITSLFKFDGAYTKLIDNGSGGYITNDTVLDIKVSLSPPTNKDTLKIVIQYLMGKRTHNDRFKNVSCVGIFNPRLNVLYKLKISEIPVHIIKEIESDVIGYSIGNDIAESTRVHNIRRNENIDIFQYIYNDEVELNETIKNSRMYSKLKEANVQSKDVTVKNSCNSSSVKENNINQHKHDNISNNTKSTNNKVELNSVVRNSMNMPEVTKSVSDNKNTEIDLMKVGNSKIKSDFEEAASQGRLSRIISIYRSRDVDKEEFISAYMYATERRNLDVINWMLNIKPNYKHELLMAGIGVSATLGYLEMTKYIIKLDKDMYVRKNGLSIALHLAIVNNSMEVVQYITRRNGSMCDVLRDDVIYLYKNGFIKEGKCVYNIYKKRNPKDKSLWNIIHGYACTVRTNNNIKRKI